MIVGKRDSKHGPGQQLVNIDGNNNIMPETSFCGKKQGVSIRMSCLHKNLFARENIDMLRCTAVLLLTLLLPFTLAACETRKEESPSVRPTGEQPAMTQGKSPDPTDLVSDQHPATTRPSTSAVNTTLIFKEPTQPSSYELPSGALATWRDFAAVKPVLLLFSAHPFLDPLRPGTNEELRQLVLNGTPAEIDRRGRLLNANPAFLPPQTLSVAIAADLFSEIVYVMPTTGKIEDFPVQNIRKRMIAHGFMTEKEAAALILKDGVISGTLRGLPFRCVHPDALPAIDRPVVLHVDLGYFKDLYVNEVRTPVYGLIYQFATTVRDRGYTVLAVTLSYSNQEAGFSLESRFMISNLADVLRRPTLLEGNTPPSWELRSSALYASTMFAESRANELIEQAAKTSPEDPAALHALALLQFRQNQPDQAFVTLDRAVALDRGYALEYSELAARGLELGQWTKAIELLRKSAEHFPENDIVRIRLADTLIQRGRVKEARPVLADLMKRHWSPIYHPGVSDLLKEMMEATRDDSVVPLADEPLGSSPAAPRFQMPASHMGVPPGQ